MTDMTVRVSGGFGTEYPGMSPSLRARIAQSDAEDAAAAERRERAHRARWQAAQERAEDEATWQLARERGVPLAEARREIGHEPREFIELCSARADLEDARRAAAAAQVMRRAAIDAGLLDVSEAGPSERAFGLAAEVAARTAPADEPFDAARIATGIRGRWLRRHYERME